MRPEQWVIVVLLVIGAWGSWEFFWIGSPALRLGSLLVTGDYRRALELVERLEKRKKLGSILANGACCVLIGAGQYRQALKLGARCQEVNAAWPLLQVNLAEAEYNLGLWQEALTRLDQAAQRKKFDIMTKAGEACQRAWILCRMGKHEEAANAYAAARIEHLPREYYAEYFFTRAHLALGAGQAALALEAAEEGLRCAVRKSSNRNGLNMRARALAATGDIEAALVDFQKAADDDYQYQGGDDLLAWGDLLASLGKQDAATNAWKLAVQRDPESESAALVGRKISAPHLFRT